VAHAGYVLNDSPALSPGVRPFRRSPEGEKMGRYSDYLGRGFFYK
jgi:hypothetical protein